ncbi:MAG: Nif11-like leader peptide family RiPP precursor [Clostridia bacterium]|nr:Nif11-like leader peptide family RiPP precursor [Clostridia bacterium]MBQ6120972.1 Nif11-like leader peptide family RiPP precursor [Clostridia bacterium]
MNYVDFRKRLAGDAAFRAKFEGCETLDALIEAAAKEGYTFTAEEVRNNTELLPEELMTAAGGINVANAFNPERKIVDW